jgi:hypothetical protein
MNTAARARSRTVATVVGSSLLIAACTSAHPTAPGTTSAAAGADFRTRATGLCNASNRALSTAAQHAFVAQRPSAATWRTFMLTTGLPLVQKRFDAFRPDAHSRRATQAHPDHRPRAGRRAQRQTAPHRPVAGLARPVRSRRQPRHGLRHPGLRRRRLTQP